LNTKSNTADNKQLLRPSTESLETFIRDVCEIEDNGMETVWLNALRGEDIRKYSHLSNLNRVEWERINKLSMNALKTMKTYVDQDKQMADVRKTAKKHDSNNQSKQKCKLFLF
jgi:hypothetical protein